MRISLALVVGLWLWIGHASHKLEAHSGLSHSYVTTTSTIGANTSSLNINTTSPSSSSRKR